MSPAAYEIRVAGALGPAAREAFRGLSADLEPAATVLSGDLDQEQLHRLLDVIRGLGLELIDVRQVPTPPETEPAGARSPLEDEDPRGAGSAGLAP